MDDGADSLAEVIIRKMSFRGAVKGGAYECSKCPEGSVSLGSTLTCEKCIPGTEANKDSTGCTPCKEGYYNSKEMGTCTKCPAFTTSARHSKDHPIFKNGVKNDTMMTEAATACELDTELHVR